MTKIEALLFLNDRTHWITSLEFLSDKLTVAVRPDEHVGASVLARFDGVELESFDSSYVDDPMEYPYNIIGFDSMQLSSERWRFCLNTDAGEWAFESNWPTIHTQADR